MLTNACDCSRLAEQCLSNNRELPPVHAVKLSLAFIEMLALNFLTKVVVPYPLLNLPKILPII